MNNRYRNAPGLRGPTKATASTLCQKCLKRDIYECTVSAQDRPYLTRPSRTQQFQNPNLRPKLSSDVPNDLLRTKGLADELLAKREEERGRKRDDDAQGLPPRRPRSESLHSMSSVSTISTNRSHSRSPPRHSRGRDRGGSVSSHHSKTKKRRYSDSSPGSVSSYSSGERARSHSREWARDRNTRRRRRESSPGERGRRVNSSQDRGRRYRSRTRSMDRDQIAKERRSMTPETLHGWDYHTRRPRGSMSPPEPSHSRSEHAHSRRPRHETNNPALQPRRERSLSPYSKRLALTQAMNVGR